MTHWVVSDCDLKKVSVCTPSRDCIGLHRHVVRCICAWNFGTKFFIGGREGGVGGGECETPRKSNFQKKGNMVISVKIRNFSISRMTKWTSPLESPQEI